MPDAVGMHYEEAKTFITDELTNAGFHYSILFRINWVKRQVRY